MQLPVQSQESLDNGDQVQLTPTPDSNRDLLLPDLLAEPPNQIFIWVNSRGIRELWFDTSVINTDDGPLEMRGEYDQETDQTRAVQRINTADGSTVERLVGYFVFHPTHDHWHFDGFADIELHSIDSSGSPDTLMTTAHKIAFCIYDLTRLNPPLPNSPPGPVYLGCDPVIQGLSVGWRDRYDPTLPGQQIEIGDLPDGIYIMRTVANPDDRILEKDDTNNTADIYIEIRGIRSRIIPAP